MPLHVSVLSPAFPEACGCGCGTTGTFSNAYAPALVPMRSPSPAHMTVPVSCQLFASDPAKYTGPVGLNRMKTMTGNTVDLDTVVLRCNDPTVLQTVNKMNEAKGEPGHATIEDFSQSRQAAEIAVATALPLLECFVQELRLTEAQQAARCVQTPQVPATASTNTEEAGPGPGDVAPSVRGSMSTLCVDSASVPWRVFPRG